MTTTQNNGTMNSKQKREAKKQEDANRLLTLAQQQTQPIVDVTVNTDIALANAIAAGKCVPNNETEAEAVAILNATATQRETALAEAARKATKDKGNRVHGPYMTREDASKYIVRKEMPLVDRAKNTVAPHYVTTEGNPTASPYYPAMTLFTCSVDVASIERMLAFAKENDGTCATSWYGNNSQHALYQHTQHLGGKVSSVGNGASNGKVAALAKRASELEMALETALETAKNAVIQVENARFSELVAQCQRVAAAGLPIEIIVGGIQSESLRERVRAAMADQSAPTVSPE